MPHVIPVRFRYAGQDLWFDPQDIEIREGDHVIVSTERGTEIGLVSADPFVAEDSQLPDSPLKPVLRVADEADLERADLLAQQGEDAVDEFRAMVEKFQLDMKPVGVEYLFGDEKIVFYFAAEERVDFRDLVRELASRFQNRVDMRQIGVRDEAKLVGGVATCGQELCCKRFMTEFAPVSIRMAKEQDLPLNPSKISGVCGRLMCCLRYEFEAYKDFKQRAPKRNATIETPFGLAKVTHMDTPREVITLRLENGKSMSIPLGSMSTDESCASHRPCCVKREQLEELDDHNIDMALAQMDREAEFEAAQKDQPAQRTKRSRGEKSSDDRKQRSSRSRGGSKPSGEKPGESKQSTDGSQEQKRTSRRRRKPQGQRSQQLNKQPDRNQVSEGDRDKQTGDKQQAQRKPRRRRPANKKPAEGSANTQRQSGEKKSEGTNQGAASTRRRRRRPGDGGGQSS